MSDRVLLIDDDQRLVTALKLRLEGVGYRVNTAFDGAEGVAEAARCQPDVIILDVRMPKMDGFETCKIIRTLPDLREIPIVILTASVENSTSRAIVEAGGNTFMRKPYSLPNLLEVIRNAIARRETRRQTA